MYTDDLLLYFRQASSADVIWLFSAYSGGVVAWDRRTDALCHTDANEPVAEFLLCLRTLALSASSTINNRARRQCSKLH